MSVGERYEMGERKRTITWLMLNNCLGFGRLCRPITIVDYFYSTEYVRKYNPPTPRRTISTTSPNKYAVKLLTIRPTL